MAVKSLFLSVVLFVLVTPALASDPSSAEKDTQSLLSAFMSYTDLRITSVQQSLEILASTAEVKSGKWESMKDLLGVYQKLDGKLVVWYVLPDGTYYTAEKGRMEVKLSDRSYFADLMAGRKVTASLVVSRSTGQRSAVTAIPIEEGGRVIGGIGVSLFLDRFAEDVSSVLSLRPSLSFFAMAPNGQTTLHPRADRHFLDPREQGSETLKTTVNEMLSQTAGRSTYFFDNLNKTAVYRTSPVTQWKFAIISSAPPQK
ncbi:MAG: hypothetical protein M1376_15130 [Planctomycetes bacterium]|nr:hypothetical protein [Planctomycetota bacterium]